MTLKFHLFCDQVTGPDYNYSNTIVTFPYFFAHTRTICLMHIILLTVENNLERIALDEQASLVTRLL